MTGNDTPRSSWHRQCACSSGDHSRGARQLHPSRPVDDAHGDPFGQRKVFCMDMTQFMLHDRHCIISINRLLNPMLLKGFGRRTAMGRPAC